MQRQAMGVALHIVLLPFFELLHSTIDSYDADFIESAFFLLSCGQLLRLMGGTPAHNRESQNAIPAFTFNTHFT